MPTFVFLRPVGNGTVGLKITPDSGSPWLMLWMGWNTCMGQPYKPRAGQCSPIGPFQNPISLIPFSSKRSHSKVLLHHPRNIHPLPEESWTDSTVWHFSTECSDVGARRHVLVLCRTSNEVNAMEYISGCWTLKAVDSNPYSNVPSRYSWVAT